MSQNTVNPWKAQQQFWNSTVTGLSHGARELWKNPRVTMIRIEVLVSAVAGVLFLLAIFGSQRRRSRNWFLQKGVFGAYTLSFSLAMYLLGSMQSSGVKSSMYPIWAICLIILHGCTDSITAYSLDDNRQKSRSLYQAIMYLGYTLLLLFTVRTDYDPFLIFMIAYIAFLKYAQRLAVCNLASSSWNLNKVVADYMYEEPNRAVITTMESCNYLVDWPSSQSKFDAPTYIARLSVEDPDEVIDIGKIWRCKDMSLVPDLKDACLSFSLFHLLRGRFFGFSCDEYKDNAHNFVFGVLLSKNKDGATDYNKVFKVIEVELAFMYDFFFTKYAVIYYGSIAATIWSFVSVIVISITAYLTARTTVKIFQGDSAVVSSTTDDTVITLVILASTALLEFLQLLLYWMSIWGRVSFACQCIRGEQERLNRKKTRGSCFIMGLKQYLSKIYVPRKHYWQHKLGQYSLLDSLSSRPRPSAVTLTLAIGRPIMMRMVRILYLWDLTSGEPRDARASEVRQKTGKSVELTDKIKEAVIDSLIRSGGTLSNGRSSLRFHKVHDLLWACEWEMHPGPSWSKRKQNQTHIILTWHIATCYCEKVAPFRHEAALSPNVHFSIATELSKYCGYLVVSAPKLLPGHHHDTASKFDAAALEAITFLGMSTNKYEAMKRLPVPNETNTIFASGLKLGRQLEEMKEAQRWKVMADFWSEMVLYLAPSANVEEHIEQLAQGGEFITHLWALLFHAGILEGDQAGGV